MRARSITSGFKYLVELVEETDEATDDDLWCRLWIGDREFLLPRWFAGEADEDDEVRSPEELSTSDALVGGDDARGEDFCGEVSLVLVEEEEWVEVLVVLEDCDASDTR